MGRKRKSNDNNNKAAAEKANSQEPSTSSSKRNQKRHINEIDNVKKGKKLKTELKVESEQVSFDDLPPEMLMKILKYLDTKDLVVCRLLNRKWNGVATEILQSRTDFEIKFGYIQDTRSYKLLGKENEDGRSLLDFIECFHASNYFPYTRFRFNSVDCSPFDNKNWAKFIADFEEKIKCLKLSMNFDSPYLTVFTKKLSDLLLIQLPKLEEFGLELRVLYQPEDVDEIDELRLEF